MSEELLDVIYIIKGWYNLRTFANVKEALKAYYLKLYSHGEDNNMFSDELACKLWLFPIVKATIVHNPKLISHLCYHLEYSHTDSCNYWSTICVDLLDYILLLNCTDFSWAEDKPRVCENKWII